MERGGLAGAELVGEEGEQHREERDRAPDHQGRAGPAGLRACSVIAAVTPVALATATSSAAAAGRGGDRGRTTATRAGTGAAGVGDDRRALPPPEPRCEPLLCVTTGWLRPPPCRLPEWCEPLVWVTTGVACEPEVGAEVEAPLEAVVTGEEPKTKKRTRTPVEEAPVVALPPEPEPPPRVAARQEPAGTHRVFRLDVLGDVDRAADHLGPDQRLGGERASPSGSPALRARPVRPPRPTIVATAAIRVFKFFTSSYLLAGFALAQSGEEVFKRTPRRG